MASCSMNVDLCVYMSEGNLMMKKKKNYGNGDLL